MSIPAAGLRSHPAFALTEGRVRQGGHSRLGVSAQFLDFGLPAHVLEDTGTVLPIGVGPHHEAVAERARSIRRVIELGCGGASPTERFDVIIMLRRS